MTGVVEHVLHMLSPHSLRKILSARVCHHVLLTDVNRRDLATAGSIGQNSDAAKKPD